MMRLWVGLLLLAVLLAAVPWLQVDEEIPAYAEREEIRSRLLSTDLDRASASWDASEGQYVWGRTMQPRFDMQLCAPNVVQWLTQQKEFVWIGLTAGPWLAGVAILQFNYVSILALHLFNVETGESWRSKTVSPLWFAARWTANGTGAIGPTAAGHSIAFGTVLHAARAAVHFTGRTIEVNFSAPLRRWSDGAVQDVSVRAVASLPRAMLGLVFPIGPRRAAVVGKCAAALFEAPMALQLGAEVWSGGGSLAMDYTRGSLRRHTRWFWACAAAPGGYGFHLSAGTYDVGGRSMESGVFTHGAAIPLDAALRFKRRGSDGGEWTISGAGVHLRFRRMGAHDGEMRFGIVSGNLDHAWGIFDGEITANGTNFRFDAIAGVLEDHDAIW